MGIGCCAEPAGPMAVYWTADHAADRLDLKHMGRSLRRRGRTDEERALEVFLYVRRTMFHYPMRNESHADQFDAAKLINVYGYSFCTQQGVVAAALARATGLKSRVIGIPGHGMYEVYYGGRWHAFCTEFAFFVPFLPCAGGPPILSEREGTKACPHSLTCRYYDEKFFTRGVKDWRSLGAPNSSGYSAWMRLLRGELLRLGWESCGRFVPPRDLPRSAVLAKRFWPPRHICGEKDRANPFFDEIAHYARRFKGRKIYRYYGSGAHIWKPRMGSRNVLREFACTENVDVAAGALRPRENTAPAIAEFEMAGPYPYVDGMVRGVTNVKAGGRLIVSLQGNDPQGPWHKLWKAPSGRKRFKLDLGKLVLPVSTGRRTEYTRYRFRLRVEMIGRSELTGLEIHGSIQHNWMALPRLIPGRNVLTVRTRHSAKRVDSQDLLVFELAWREGQRSRKLRRRPTKTSNAYVVNVRAKTPPRMLCVLLERK